MLIGAIPAVLYMERFGCRYWANVMLPGLFIGLVLVGVGYIIDADNTYPGGVRTSPVLYCGLDSSARTLACRGSCLPRSSIRTCVRMTRKIVESFRGLIICQEKTSRCMSKCMVQC